MPSTPQIQRSPSQCVLVRWIVYGAVLSILGITIGCGKPFNVKQQPDLPPASYAARASADGVSIQAQAITDEDFLYDAFDANLISAGVLPVRVMLTNSADHAVDLQKARFELSALGLRFKEAGARQAFKRLIAYYEISVYNKSGYKKSLDDFSAYALDVKMPLAAGQSRQGLVFFLAPSESAHGIGLTLVVSGLSSNASRERGAVELRLN
jgi:hypothetical protein